MQSAPDAGCPEHFLLLSLLSGGCALICATVSCMISWKLTRVVCRGGFVPELALRSTIDGNVYALVQTLPGIGGVSSAVVCEDEAGRRYCTSLEAWQAGAVQEEMQPDVTHLSPAKEKIALFRSLFRGRDDVHATGYLARSGKIAYTPACTNAWNPGVCRRGKTKRPCDGCPGKSFAVLSDRNLVAHFQGKDARFRDVIGIYPMLADSSCWFLAADFDDAGWQEAAAAYRDAASRHGLACAMERSRSGEGAHVWIFFGEPIPAKMARQLGSLFLDDARRHCSKVGFDAYDRLFPTQDTLPKDGLGNLVALPLQGAAVRRGCSVFVDEDFHAYSDQWAYLAGVRRVSKQEVQQLLSEAQREAEKPGIYRRQRQLTESQGEAAVSLPETVEIQETGMLEIPRTGLPQALVADIEQLAVIANPEFFAKQRMHERIWNTPRYLWFGEEDKDTIRLPRGCLDRLCELLEERGARVAIADRRGSGRQLHATFMGELAKEQQAAFEALSREEDGLLVAPTGFGKTVIAARLIAEKQVSTLVLVPRSPLLAQWKQSLERFLSMEDEPQVLVTATGRKRKHQPDKIGIYGGGTKLAGGLVDIALPSSLMVPGVVAGERKVSELVRGYGMVIVDEVQHVPSASLIEVLKASGARFLFGLTATPKRKDRLDRAIPLFMGPVRFSADAKRQLAAQKMKRWLVPHFTGLAALQGMDPSDWQETLTYVSEHEERNVRIAKDVKASVDAGRFPLVLVRLVKHAESLAVLLEESLDADVKVFKLVGTDDAALRQKKLDALHSLAPDVRACIVATDSYLGEGFDEPRLDSLFLAAPISWSGLLTQIVGRLHRAAPGKHEVVVHDYVDEHMPLCVKQWKSRLKTYVRLGYELEDVQQDGSQGHIVRYQESRSRLVEEIEEAKTSVLLSSGWVSVSALHLLLPVLEAALKRSIALVLCVPASCKKDSECTEALRGLEKLGAKVSITERRPQNAVVADHRIVWFGSLPALAFPARDDASIRIANAELAQELEAAAAGYAGGGSSAQE